MRVGGGPSFGAEWQPGRLLEVRWLRRTTGRTRTTITGLATAPTMGQAMDADPYGTATPGYVAANELWPQGKRRFTPAPLHCKRGAAVAREHLFRYCQWSRAKLSHPCERSAGSVRGMNAQ